MEDILDKFNTFTAKPVKFLTVQKDVKDDITSWVKTLYDFTKSEEQCSRKKNKGAALPKLIVKDFDEEQIWQEIELQNSECWDQLVWEVANSISAKDLRFPVEIKDSEAENEEDQEGMDEEIEEAEDEGSLKEKIEEKPKKKQKKFKTKSKGSIVDDQFFKLDEMEQFLLKEEKEKKVHSDSDEESIDMFDEIDDESEDEGTKGMYNDFFDADDNDAEDGNDDENADDDENVDDEVENARYDSKKHFNEVSEKKSKKKDKKVRFAAMGDSESDDEDLEEDEAENTKIGSEKDEKKSEFEHRQDRLKQTITRLEEKMLKEAPWQLKGEVDAVKRPQNSLLEEVVDFDLTSRPPPIITEETTLTLEQIIRQRIKDKAWDDVEKKEKPVDDQLSFRKTEILDQSKSKLSLAQVYEAEYLKQKQAASGEKEDEQEPESHKEVRDAMTKLFAKLDALTHYHYTPKAPQAEVKIVSNTPAISMEEVAPVATSDAALLAPEEVKKKHRGDLMSKEERTRTDKKRERRKKKKLQQKKGHVAKVTEHRNTKKGVEANDKSLKTSKAFFQQLNDDTTEIMPSEVRSGKSLQRELADSIIRMVNEPVTQGLRPLHYAIWQRYLEATRLLLVRGCDVNARDDCGYSALHLSSEHGYTELVKLLLQSGAAVDYRPDTGKSSPNYPLRRALRLAIRNKHYEVARLLLEHGADPNKRYFFGAEINLVSDPEYLELLLTFGANPDSRDRAGLTPLMKAARQRKVIMKTQFRDPDGILNHLQNVTAEEYQHIFYLLLEAAEAFDLCMIKRNSTLNPTQKEKLIERAKYEYM
ncbi:hypothetical protein MSG28_011598 [Choristoneura fumiferana]|uniref:Uncharacterized protein n=2 Tax=Choristoneura fumiferana TaxID=7141 RepID=A0ACC0JNV2_CHOFU|nr:hypothetical protein MSG28_011598 [Choristoneura fumiferana]